MLDDIRTSLAILRNPDHGFGIILNRENHAIRSLKYFFWILVLYTVAIIGWYFGGAEVTAPPIIPIDNYYLAEIFFLMPVFFLAILSATSVAYLLAKALKSQSVFDDYLSLLIHAAILPTFLTLISDLVQAFFFTTGIIDQKQWLELTSDGLGLIVVISYLALYVIGFLILFPLAVKKASGLKLFPSIVIGLFSFIVYHLYLFVFIR
jgi:hypothetical protein